ncbi:glycosyltransferase [Flavobacterium foetidum]|uniref:glycosyltransferase n=1 Tax=Flavobacterium foetidum TaxID=2026681 RepID=UPI0010752294|nr:glycosyltransferase [Flavobacterium foetidum]KAF2513556.1 glycosyltransferase [Flavobacterium foetidum]
MKISVVIRTKNQEKALDFLLKNLKQRYAQDIDEVVVLDNLSVDATRKITEKYEARFVSIEKFSYGGSANIGASSARNEIVVIFSAHSYPVSPDFFKVIKQKFEENPHLAGVRCLHSTNDYKNYILGIDAITDPNKSGLIFSGSAFKREVWEIIPFNENVPTFEDKDWTKKVLKAGYKIDFAPVVFNYEVKRTPAQEYFRFTRDVFGNYQIWHHEDSGLSILKGFIMSLIRIIKQSFVQTYYAFKRMFFMVRFKFNKPQKFDY